MEFDICIITQIVYAIVTLKLIISSCSSAYIVHISTPTGLNARIYDGVLFVFKHFNTGITMTLPHIAAGD